jgi:hypothetical protein
MAQKKSQTMVGVFSLLFGVLIVGSVDLVRASDCQRHEFGLPVEDISPYAGGLRSSSASSLSSKISGLGDKVFTENGFLRFREKTADTPVGSVGSNSQARIFELEDDSFDYEQDANLADEKSSLASELHSKYVATDCESGGAQVCYPGHKVSIPVAVQASTQFAKVKDNPLSTGLEERVVFYAYKSPHSAEQASKEGEF